MSRAGTLSGKLLVVVAALAVVLPGCGSAGVSLHRSSAAASLSASPGVPVAVVSVIRGWSDALRVGHVAVAARYFRIPSVFFAGNGAPILLRSLAQAEIANAALPCGATYLSAHTQGRYVNALFRLTDRPGPGGERGCGSGTGQTARVNILIRHGRIVQWLRAPNRARRQRLAADTSLTTAARSRYGAGRSESRRVSCPTSRAMLRAEPAHRADDCFCDSGGILRRDVFGDASNRADRGVANATARLDDVRVTKAVVGAGVRGLLLMGERGSRLAHSRGRCVPDEAVVWRATIDVSCIPRRDVTTMLRGAQGGKRGTGNDFVSAGSKRGHCHRGARR